MKFLSLLFLVVLFFLALVPEWSILNIGKQLAENQAIATLIIQALLVIIAVAVVVFIYFNLPLKYGKKKMQE